LVRSTLTVTPPMDGRIERVLDIPVPRTASRARPDTYYSGA
jgi:hypothetical protein